jgi:hypothetical protein
VWENTETFQQQRQTERKEDSPHRPLLSLSQTPRCLNNHKNLHTVHRNGLVEGKKVENKKNGPHKDFQTPNKKEKSQ